MTPALTTWSRRALFALALPLVCVLGVPGAYPIVLITIVLAVSVTLEGRLAEAYRSSLARFFAAVFCIFALCFIATAEELRDVSYALNFTMLLLGGPLLLTMQRGARPGNTATVAWLALSGTMVAALVMLAGMALGDYRGGWFTLSAIQLADTAVLLGFLAFIGVFAVDGPRRWLFIAGPILGGAIAIATQSRGPVIAAALLVPFVAALILYRAPRRSRSLLMAALVAIIALGLVVAGMQGRLAVLPEIAQRMLSGEAMPDFSTRVRLVVYEAAIRAFLESPLVGHGWGEMVTATLPHLPPDAPTLARQLPHLHSDILDIAVSAGSLGLLGYVLLLAAPIVAALRSPLDSQYGLRLYGVAILVATYFGAGLTNLMIGFELHTALYVVMATMLVGYCRDEPQQTGGKAAR